MKLADRSKLLPGSNIGELQAGRSGSRGAEAPPLVLDEAPERINGDLQGDVVWIDNEQGVGYVKEVRSGTLYGLSRQFLGATVWEQLKDGVHVEFTDNGRNAAATLIVIGR